MPCARTRSPTGARAPGEQSLFGQNTGQSSTAGAAALCSCEAALRSRLPAGKEPPEAAGVSAQGTAPPGSHRRHRLPSSRLCPPHAPLCSYSTPLCPATAYPVHPLPHYTRTNAGIVNELGALCSCCCVFHTPRAASDVRKPTWKKHLRSTLTSRAALGSAQPASSAPGAQTVLSLDTSPQSRTGFLSCRSKEEISLPLPCPARSQRLLCNC